MSLANESKPDRKAVIVLTCCALQSACYSPTGIVILFILAQIQGEVQTNLTVNMEINFPHEGFPRSGEAVTAGD